jgi:glycosyltransferase involved in cell wall biosynthesis
VPTTTPTGRRYRLAVLASHPVQYAAPLYRYLAGEAGFDLTVLYASRMGLEDYTDEGFSQMVRWDTDLLSGYRSTFLPGARGRQAAGFLAPVCLWVAPVLLERRFDVVIVPGYSHAYYVLGVLAARAAGARVLMRGESFSLESGGASRRRQLRNRALPALLRLVDGYLAVGTPQRQFAAHFGIPPERIFPSPYSVDNAFFIAQAERYRPLREQTLSGLGLSPKAPTILYVAKLIPRKRPLDLLTAVHLLSERGVQANVVLVGDGTERTALERWAAEHGLQRVRFVGFRNQSEIGRYYAAADLFVLPSADEPWGLVVNEAMCAGLAVITSDRVGAAADLVRRGTNGYVYPCGDTAALAAHLAELCQDHARRQAFGRASRQIIEHWGFREVAAGLGQALATLAGPGARP